MPFCLKIFELNTNKNIQKYLKILHKIKFQCCIIFVKLFYENIMNNPKVEFIQYLFGWDCITQFLNYMMAEAKCSSSSCSQYFDCFD